MRYLLVLLALACQLGLSAQSYPTDAQVLAAVKNYHGQLETAKVVDNWILEREAGYTFSNMAKRPVTAQTKKDANGMYKKLRGLAIYVRGGAAAAWSFSRFFVTETETFGLATPSNEQLIAETWELLRTQPQQIMPDHRDVCWMYGLEIKGPLTAEQDGGDFLFGPVWVDFEEKFVTYEHPFEGGVKRLQRDLVLRCRPKDGVLRVCVATYGDHNTEVSRTPCNQRQWNQLATVGQRPLNELSGPGGALKTAPAATATPAAQGTPPPPASAPAPPPAAAEPVKKTVRLPKVKIGIR
jgi:hypothetical protein